MGAGARFEARAGDGVGYRVGYRVGHRVGYRIGYRVRVGGRASGCCTSSPSAFHSAPIFLSSLLLLIEHLGGVIAR